VAELNELLALQRLDTAIEQANHRLTHLPEIERRRECMEVVSVLERRLADLEAELSLATTTLVEGERVTRDIDARVLRLEGQLRTVTASREAEALQHEIATLRLDREASDERGIVALEDSERLEQELAATTSEVVAARAELESVLGQLRAAQRAVQIEIEELSARRVEQTGLVGGALGARYEKLRERSTRVVVATLNGSACGGCHLDLSQVEKEGLRRLPEDEIPECPHCGCMLVL
jgi:predicted  nucleic acid-binding Zn-ribbon protein